MTERVNQGNEKSFDDELAELFQLDEHTQSFLWSTGSFIDTFTAGMNGTGGKHFYQVVEKTHTTREEHVNFLKTLSEYMFTTMPRDAAVRAWAQAVQGGLLEICGAMVDIDQRAYFEIPDMDELLSLGLDYYEGVQKALEEGIDLSDLYGGEIDEEAEKALEFDAIAVENLADLFASDDINPEDMPTASLRDEYGQWVLAAYGNGLGEHLDDLLMLCPQELYPEE